MVCGWVGGVLVVGRNWWMESIWALKLMGKARLNSSLGEEVWNDGVVVAKTLGL